MASGHVEIGRIQTVNPARREVRVKPGTGKKHLFQGMAWALVLLADGTELRCKVDGVRGASSGYIVKLSAGVTRDTVARLKGARVIVDAEEAPCPGGGLDDVSALLGFQVYDVEGAGLGEVVATYSALSNNAIEIKGPGGGEMLLPVIDEVIAGVDLERGSLTVRDIAPYVVEDED